MLNIKKLKFYPYFELFVSMMLTKQLVQAWIYPLPTSHRWILQFKDMLL